MTAFEFIFPLFGLLLGLSYAEMLAGLARALKSHRHIRIGWLTPLLGLLVLINLTMFWFGAWQFREAEVPTSGSLLLTLLIGGIYFLAASLVFPDRDDPVTDLDEHFLSIRRMAILAIATCNLVGLWLLAINAGWVMSRQWWIVNGLWLATLLLTALGRDRRLALAGLVAMIGFHAIGLFFGG
jgi:hypothetical protein